MKSEPGFEENPEYQARWQRCEEVIEMIAAANPTWPAEAVQLLDGMSKKPLGYRETTAFSRMIFRAIETLPEGTQQELIRTFYKNYNRRHLPPKGSI